MHSLKERGINKKGVEFNKNKKVYEKKCLTDFHSLTAVRFRTKFTLVGENVSKTIKRRIKIAKMASKIALTLAIGDE